MSSFTMSIIACIFVAITQSIVTCRKKKDKKKEDAIRVETPIINMHVLEESVSTPETKRSGNESHQRKRPSVKGRGSTAQQIHDTPTQPRIDQAKTSKRSSILNPKDSKRQTLSFHKDNKGKQGEAPPDPTHLKNQSGVSTKEFNNDDGADENNNHTPKTTGKTLKQNSRSGEDTLKGVESTMPHFEAQ